jgi:hypothetical protein
VLFATVDCALLLPFPNRLARWNETLEHSLLLLADQLHVPYGNISQIVNSCGSLLARVFFVGGVPNIPSSAQVSAVLGTITIQSSNLSCGAVETTHGPPTTPAAIHSEPKKAAEFVIWIGIATRLFFSLFFKTTKC